MVTTRGFRRFVETEMEQMPGEGVSLVFGTRGHNEGMEKFLK